MAKTHIVSSSITTASSPSTYVVPPIVIMPSTTSSKALKHTNSTRKKGRFRVRRVSKTPDGIKNSLKREASSSPVKTVSIVTNAVWQGMDQSTYLTRSINTRRTDRKTDVMIYDVSKLFSRYYDIQLASKYTLHESGNS